MITMTEYIDDAKKKLGIKTTTKLAQRLGVQGNYLLRVYHQQQACNDATVIRLAKLINDDPSRALIIAGFTAAMDNHKPIYETMFRQYEAFTKKNGNRPKTL